jgi:hypothetical protein
LSRIGSEKCCAQSTGEQHQVHSKQRSQATIAPVKAEAQVDVHMRDTLNLVFE